MTARRWDPAWRRDGDGAIRQARWDRWGKGRDGERERGDWWMIAPRFNERRSFGGREMSGAVERKRWRLGKRDLFFSSGRSVV